MKQIKTTVAPLRRLTTTLYQFIRKHLVFIISYGFTTLPYLLPKTAYAATGMPWDKPLSVILTSLQSDFLKFCTIASIIVFGVILAFSEDNSIFRRAIKTIFGLSIACSAASFGLSFFGFSG